jgi:hypothetical protein
MVGWRLMEIRQKNIGYFKLYELEWGSKISTKNKPNA